jgi:hypothetical protein
MKQRLFSASAESYHFNKTAQTVYHTTTERYLLTAG